MISRKLLYQIIVFILTFLTYAAFHSCRAVWSYSKDFIRRDPYYSMTDDTFGTVDLVFLLCYSSALYGFGWLGDKLDLRIYLGLGLVFTGFSFGGLAVMKIFNYDNSLLFIILQGIQGVFQSVGWPGVMGCMGNWIDPSERGLILGIWGGSGNFGNIIGFEVSSIAMDDMKLDWSYAILCSVVFVFSMAVINTIFLKPYPERVGIDIKRHMSLDSQASYLLDNKKTPLLDQSLNDSNMESKPIGFFRAWTIPGVPFYTMSYACIKGTAVGILLWLPSYLKSLGLEDNVARISQMNDIGQFIGGFLLGIICDRLKKKSVLQPVFLFSSTIVFILIKYAVGEYTYLYYIYFFFVGIFLGGPYNVIGSAIAADLGKHPLLSKNKRALSTVTGIIEGTGCFMAAVIQKIIPYLGQHLFLLFTGTSLLAGLILTPMAIKDFKKILRRRKKHQNKFKAELGKKSLETNF